jgi:hypothetical protein
MQSIEIWGEIQLVAAMVENATPRIFPIICCEYAERFAGKQSVVLFNWCHVDNDTYLLIQN